jgi:hypothetical protein
VSGKVTIGFACLAVTLCGGLVASSAAAASSRTADDRAAAPAAAKQTDQSWCTQKGGKAVAYSPWYNTNSAHPTPLGGSFLMCEFTNTADQTRILVTADSLAADRPTMAALAYKHKPAATENPPGDGQNPAAWYCGRIGGTDQFGDNQGDVGGWAPSSAKAPQDIIGMCVFADRSMIDEWGLTYHTHDIIRGADLTEKWRATIP